MIRYDVPARTREGMHSTLPIVEHANRGPADVHHRSVFLVGNSRQRVIHPLCFTCTAERTIRAFSDTVSLYERRT